MILIKINVSVGNTPVAPGLCSMLISPVKSTVLDMLSRVFVMIINLLH